jgi:putative phosphonate metabolism protein
MAGESRVAIYYCPDHDDPLYASGASWLGRDPITGAPVPAPSVPGLQEMTAEPRGYGFHATLKPPMRLAAQRTWSELLTVATSLARSLMPFALPPLAVMDLRGFLALRETTPSPQLQALADATVEGLDAFRSLPSEAELARRRKASLSATQDAMLLRWGYPYVFDEWFFHMTLTRRLTDAEKVDVLPAARSHFTAALAVPRQVTSICLFTQTAPGAPFVIAERLRLGA